MRASHSFQIYSTLLLFFSTFTAAWPRWLPELDGLIVRADSSSSSTAAGAAASSSNQGITLFGATNSKTATASKTSSGTTTTKTGSSNNTSSITSSAAATFSADLPAGGISMQTPAVISGEQYFRIGEYVTFGWNYTSLLATPSYINVMATCTVNSQLYPIAMNQTVGSTGAVTWDTGAYQATAAANPLLTDTYTLIIYDAESSISAAAEAGYLATFDDYTFGMYVSQPYVPLSEYVCPSCSGALSVMERRALGVVVGVSVITVLSFTWFVNGLDVIW